MRSENIFISSKEDFSIYNSIHSDSIEFLKSKTKHFYPHINELASNSIKEN